MLTKTQVSEQVGFYIRNDQYFKTSWHGLSTVKKNQDIGCINFASILDSKFQKDS